mmetsp:Transcript_57146/g.110335  ORF Transcript_57146/g.110335 Transcript_57146/m.110335 type:complete len:450 (-) Transcript_57146:129-1478(-)
MVVCRRDGKQGQCLGCFGFWSHSKNKETFTCLLRPERPQQFASFIGLKSPPPPTLLEPPEAQVVPWHLTEVALQSGPVDDVQPTHYGTPHCSLRSDAPRGPAEEKDCSKHVKDHTPDTKPSGIHDECLVQAVEVLSHAQAAEAEAQREAESAVQHAMKQAKPTASQHNVDLVKDGLKEEHVQALQSEKKTGAKLSMGVAFESQQQRDQEQEQEQQPLPQQRHQSAEKTEVDQHPAKPAQQGARRKCQLEIFTAKPKKIQTLQIHRKRTEHDAARDDNDHTLLQQSVGKTTNWRGLPGVAEKGPVKQELRPVRHGRTRRAAWSAAAAATAAAAAAAFVLAEAKESQLKQGSREEDGQAAAPASAEANTGRSAPKADAAVSACRDTWKATVAERRSCLRQGNCRSRGQTSHRHGSIPTQRAKASAKPANQCGTILFGCGACFEDKCEFPVH